MNIINYGQGLYKGVERYLESGDGYLCLGEGGMFK